MATLTAEQLTELRQQLARDVGDPGALKATVNAASQAIENFFETTARAAISTAINTATAPVVLSGPVKAALVKHYLRQKFERGG